MRGATALFLVHEFLDPISIHAPHAGSDPGTQAGHDLIHISIHAPHAGSDLFTLIAATTGMHFNPRSPCGERRGLSDL